LQAKYDQVVDDRDKIRQDYEEIVLLREEEMSLHPLASNNTQRQHQPQHHHERSLSSASDRTYKLDDLKIEYDILSSKYKLIQEEKLKLKEQNEKLKNRCTAAIHGFEKALKEREKADKDLDTSKRQYDDTKSNLQESTKTQTKLSQELKKVQKEKNSAEHDYMLVMAERDTVHAEIQDLQEDLRQTKDQVRELIIIKERAFLENEGFQREIQSVLADRDKARHEVRVLQDRVQRADKDREKCSRKCEAQMQELDSLKQERNIAKKERIEALVSRDSILKECFDVRQSFEQLASGDMALAESLKEKFSRLSTDLADAWNRMEVACHRRNWAFNERDKVLKDFDRVNDKYQVILREKSVVDDRLRKLTMEVNSSQKRHKDLQRENIRLRKTLMDKGSMLPSQDSAIDTDAPVSRLYVSIVSIVRSFLF